MFQKKISVESVSTCSALLLVMARPDGNFFVPVERRYIVMLQLVTPCQPPCALIRKQTPWPIRRIVATP